MFKFLWMIVPILLFGGWALVSLIETILYIIKKIHNDQECELAEHVSTFWFVIFTIIMLWSLCEWVKWYSTKG